MFWIVTKSWVEEEVEDGCCGGEGVEAELTRRLELVLARALQS
jgi:hypothetical protein